MQNADAILVLGRGIYKDGSIPESAKATIQKALELYNQGLAHHVVFSGKWSYSIDYVPPTTEAEAMAEYARSLGLAVSAIILEKESYTTVSNAIFIKTRVLEPQGWKRVILISLNPMDKRAIYNLRKVLGPEYESEVISADFTFPEEKMAQLIESEKTKMGFAKEFLERIKDGDHATILHLSNMELALFEVLKRTPDIQKALIGSLNLRLQGLEVFPTDIDFLTTDEGVEKVSQIFNAEVFMRRGFKVCELKLHGIEVEVGSCKGNQLRTCEFISNIKVVHVAGFDVPCLSLESELDFYTRAGREKDIHKAKLIKRELSR